MVFVRRSRIIPRQVMRFLEHYRANRALYGKHYHPATYPLSLLYDRWRWGPLGTYIARSRRIPSWTRGTEAVALARASESLPNGAVIVEIGAFLGCSAVLLAGARKLRGSGKVPCIDPFDASGDAISVPISTMLD